MSSHILKKSQIALKYSRIVEGVTESMMMMIISKFNSTSTPKGHTVPKEVQTAPRVQIVHQKRKPSSNECKFKGKISLITAQGAPR